MESKMLHGKRALVTGSVQGIGLAVALELARAGRRGRAARPRRCDAAHEAARSALAEISDARGPFVAA